MARLTKTGEHAYSRIGKIRGREAQGEFAIIVCAANQTRVARFRPDGTVDPSTEELVASELVFDQKAIHTVLPKQRGTLTLPASLRRRYGIEENTPLRIVEEGDDRFSVHPMRLVKAVDPAPSPDALLAGITPENVHPEIDFGPSVGREILSDVVHVCS